MSARPDKEVTIEIPVRVAIEVETNSTYVQDEEGNTSIISDGAYHHHMLAIQENGTRVLIEFDDANIPSIVAILHSR